MMISFDEHDSSVYGTRRMAGITAVHLVSQVLEEASIIANAAKESDLTNSNMRFSFNCTEGKPWQYLSIIKSMRGGKSILDSSTADEDSYEPNYESTNEVNVDGITNNNKLLTSTPQKDSNDLKKSKQEVSLIGQGDGGCELSQTNLSNVTSSMINNIFDMSEVDRDPTYHGETQGCQTAPNSHKVDAVTNIIDSYISTAINTAADTKEMIEEINLIQSDVENNKEEYSAFLFLAEVFGTDDRDFQGEGKNVTFYIDDDVPTPITRTINYDYDDRAECMDYEADIKHLAIEHKKNEQQNALKIMNENVNAYLSLNRDYEPYSDDDGDPILQDPKSLSNLHEIELLTAPSVEDLRPSSVPVVKQCEEMPTTSAGTSGAAPVASIPKKTLAQRCRVHGARLLSCLRGWWRRRVPGRKEPRVLGTGRPGYPMSQDTRRRTASFLGFPRISGSPSTSTSLWKFNTVNEAVVKSNNWKDYTFEKKPGEFGDGEPEIIQKV